MACFQLDKHMGLYYDDAQRQSQRESVSTIEQVKNLEAELPDPDKTLC